MTKAKAAKAISVGQYLGKEAKRYALEKDVRDCEADSVVGSAVISLIKKATPLLALMDETSESDAVVAAVRAQANVWYFG